MRKIDDLLQRFLDSIGQQEGRDYIGLFRGWQSIVGERVAAHAEPVDVRGSSLVIEADHPGWVQMVMMARGRIIREVNRRYPELGITGIMVRTVSQRTTPASPSRPGPSGRPAPDKVAPETHDDRPASAPQSGPETRPSRDEDEALGRIDDDEMRGFLARLREDLHDTEDGDG